ncbi:MAG: hypothetical protein JEZ09_09490 [Salinivirgaceae bacterium]|nr:hypothetical protein [Salinivirgaceae bacterium]
MCKKLYSLVFLGFITLNSFSQTATLLQEGVEKQIVITESNSNENVTNEVLAIVSKALAQPSNQVKLTYTVKEHQSIIKTNNKLELKIAVGNFVFTNDIAYQKFSINGFLSPSLLSFTYVWEDNEANVLKTETINNARFKNGANVFKESFIDTYDLPGYKLYLKDVSFGFDKGDLTKLDNFVTTIDAYYNADARLNMIDKELDKIRSDSLEMLETFRQQTIDNVKAFNQIKSQRFTSKLDLNASDPIQFKSHLGRVEVRNKAIKKEIENTIDNMHIAYYKKGKDWLDWKNTEKASSFFKQSIAEKSNYAPPYYELSNLEFQKENYQAAIDICVKIIGSMSPDTDTRYATIKLAESVIYKWIDIINKHLEKAAYDEALTWFTKAQDYASKIQGIKNFAEFEQIRGGLYMASYEGLVNKTKIQIEANLLQKAQQNIDSLGEFRYQHRNYISNPEKEHELLKDLYTAWMAYGKKLLEKAVPDSALFAFTQATILCKKYEVISCSEELTELMAQAVKAQYINLITLVEDAISNELADSALLLLKEAETFRSQNSLEANEKMAELLVAANQLKYNELIQIGDEAYGRNKSREALAYYEEALDIEKEFEVQKQVDLLEKVNKAVVSYIQLLCIQGESFVETLKVNDAADKLRTAKSLMISYKLGENEEVVTLIKNLQIKVKGGACDQAQYEYNIQIRAAKKFIVKKDFVLASQALQKAKSVTQSNPDCQLNTAERLGIENEISSMLSYQKKIERISKILEDKDFGDVIEEYLIVTKFYNDSCTDNFGIQHKNLFSFLKTNKAGQLIDYSVKYYTNETKTDTALIMLEELRSREYIATWSKDNQSLLGAQLARNDRENGDGTDPKEKVEEYAQYDKWYRFLKKAYLKEWKASAY